VSSSWMSNRPRRNSMPPAVRLNLSVAANLDLPCVDGPALSIVG
jgi:hypothetical protein